MVYGAERLQEAPLLTPSPQRGTGQRMLDRYGATLARLSASHTAGEAAEALQVFAEEGWAQLDAAGADALRRAQAQVLLWIFADAAACLAIST